MFSISDLGLQTIPYLYLASGHGICCFLCPLTWSWLPVLISLSSYFLPAQMSNLGELSYQPICNNTHNLVTLYFLTHFIFVLCTYYPKHIKRLIGFLICLLSVLLNSFIRTRFQIFYIFPFSLKYI